MKKILITIFSAIFLLFLVMPVFAMTIEANNIVISEDNRAHMYNFGSRVFVPTVITMKTISGDFSEAGCGDLGTYCNVEVGQTPATGDFSVEVGSSGTIGSIANFYINGDYIDNGLGATNVLASLMGGVVTTSTGIALNIFQVYWPYVLIIGIIGALVALFGRFLMSKLK